MPVLLPLRHCLQTISRLYNRMKKNPYRIKALLYPSPFKNSAGPYLARTTLYGTYGITEICKSFCSKSGNQVKSDTMEYHARLFLEELAELLTNGHYINTGYFSAGATVKGSFLNKLDKYDNNRHKVSYTFSQGHLMKKRSTQTSVEILSHITPIHFGINFVTDCVTGSKNDVLTPGRNLIIKGLKIKLTGDHADVGLCFINQSTGERIQVMPKEIIMNHHNRLMIIIPELIPGRYQLELTTQYSGNNIPLVKPRIDTFGYTLQVLSC